jgi:23S rRNA U2552 (ribose-2'-O)-methylase RlmE/FtsJ
MPHWTTKLRRFASREFSTSSASWLRRHNTDVYAAQARDQGLRSRAYFKLKEIQEKHHIISPSSLVVDLGSAPGGWSLLAADIIYKNSIKSKTSAQSNCKNENENKTSNPATNQIQVNALQSNKPMQSTESSSTQASVVNRSSSSDAKICSIDLLRMDPIPGVNFLLGNFLDPSNQQKIIQR